MIRFVFTILYFDPEQSIVPCSGPGTPIRVQDQGSNPVWQDFLCCFSYCLYSIKRAYKNCPIRMLNYLSYSNQRRIQFLNMNNHHFCTVKHSYFITVMNKQWNGVLNWDWVFRACSAYIFKLFRTKIKLLKTTCCI